MGMIDGGKIKIDKIGDRANTYDDFLGDLMVKDGDADDCRYAIYDYEYVVHSQGTEPSNRSRLFLVAWCPDSAPSRKRWSTRPLSTASKRPLPVFKKSSRLMAPTKLNKAMLK